MLGGTASTEGWEVVSLQLENHRSRSPSKLMLPTITPDKIDLPPGTRLNFPGTLADYERLLTQLGDRAATRIRFRGDLSHPTAQDE